MADHLGVIIPTFNRRDKLLSVLDCLKVQKLPDAKFSVVVVVDGSTDGTSETLKDLHPEVLIVNGDGNWWYTKCINEGLKKTLAIGCTHFLTLNDDVFFDEFYIAKLFQCLEAHGPNAIVGSASFTLSQPYRITFTGVESLVKWRLKENNYMRKFTIVEPDRMAGCKPSINLSGRGMLFSSETVSKLGMFDEKLVQYSSDTDFSYRAYKAGIQPYVSFDAKIYENEKLTSKGALYNKVTFTEYIKSFFDVHSVNSIQKRMYYFRKHGNPVLVPVFLVFTVFASVYVFFTKYRNI